MKYLILSLVVVFMVGCGNSSSSDNSTEVPTPTHVDESKNPPSTPKI